MKRFELPILVAIFLDLAGFGMAFPDIQLRAQHLGASGLLIGALLASLFVVQFLASPRWGALSDRIGRKPIVVICTGLSCLSMVVYAVSDSLMGILLSRILAGLAAANVVVAQAYLADATTEGERGAVMGRMGAAISVGLIVGPFFGGQLVELGGSRLLGYVAAAASGFSMLILWIGMPYAKPSAKAVAKPKAMIDVQLLRDLPDLRAMFILAAVAWFALACLEGTFGRLLYYRFEFPLSELGFTFRQAQGASGLVFAIESLIGFIVQAVLYVKISRRFSDADTMRFAYVMQGIGLLLTPFAPGFGWVLAVSSLYGVGLALSGVTVNTVCSRLTPDDRQGELFGLLQSARSIGFLVGPLLGGVLFDWHPFSPYLLAGGVATVAAFLVPSGVLRQLRDLKTSS